MEEERRFISGIVPRVEKKAPAWWFAFRENKLLVFQEPDSLSIPCLIDFAELELIALNQHYLGHLDGRDCYAVELVPESALPPGTGLEGLRLVYRRLDEALFWVATLAFSPFPDDRRLSMRTPSCSLDSQVSLASAIFLSVMCEIIIENFLSSWYVVLSRFEKPILPST